MADVEEVMDKLTFASQQSGISAIELAEGITTAGTAFIELGFPLDKSIALFSQFEKVGARPADVISTLNVAMTRLARDGATNAEEAFATLIQSIADAPSRMEATVIAADAFGARFGDKIAEEVRGGTFAVDEFVASMQGVAGLLDRTASETLTFGQQMGTLRNQVTLAVAPIGQALVGALNSAMPLIQGGINIIAGIAEKFSNLPGPVQGTVVVLGLLVAAIGPALAITGSLIGTYGDLITQLPKVVSAFNDVVSVATTRVVPALAQVNATLMANPFVAVAALVIALGAAFVYVYTESETFRELVSGLVTPLINVATAIRDGLGAMLVWLGESFGAAFSAVAGVVESFVGGVLNFMGKLLPQGVRDSLATFGDNMTSGVRSAVDTASKIISELRAPSLDLGVTGSNAAAQSALYGPIVTASTNTATIMTESAEAQKAALLEGVRLNTLNSKEVADLIRLQGEYRERLQSGNVTLEERNRLTIELNKLQDATSTALKANVGELATSRTAMGLHNQALKLVDIEIGGVSRSMGHLQKIIEPTRNAFQELFGDIGVKGKEEISKFFGGFGPVSIAMEALGEVFKVLKPVLDQMKAPFLAMAEILGRALVPILIAFWPIVRELAIAFSYVAEILLFIIGGIANAVGGAIAAIGGAIAKIPFLGSIGRNIQSAGQTIQGVGQAFSQASGEMKNLRDVLRSITFDATGEQMQTNDLLATQNATQAMVAANTQRMADKLDEFEQNISININAKNVIDDKGLVGWISELIVEDVERILGEFAAREERLDGEAEVV
jgi:phage-related minor tail protein